MEQNFLDATDLKLLDALQHDASRSNLALAALVHISPPTCLRRVKRLQDQGWIERQVAVLNTDRLATLQGQGLSALVEVTLDRQGAEHLDAFEARAVADATLSWTMQKCWSGLAAFSLAFTWWARRGHLRTARRWTCKALARSRCNG